jgi:hypothetical protein
MSESAEAGYGQEADMSLEDSSALDSGELAFEDSEGLDVDLEPEGIGFGGETGEFGAESQEAVSDFEFESPVDEEIALEADESRIEDFESPVDTSVAEESEISLDKEEDLIDSSELSLEELSLDESKAAGAEETEEGMEEEPAIDLEGLGLDAEESGTEEGVEEEPGIDTEGLDLDAEEPEADAESDEVELDLDDLKVNETGELEVGKEASPAEASDKPLEMDEIAMDEIPLAEEISEEAEGEDLAFDLEGESGPGSTESEEDEVSIDLEDLDLDLDLDDSKPH